MVAEGSPHVGAQLGIRLSSVFEFGQTNFDLVTMQVTDAGETPVEFVPYPEPGTVDPGDPPPWNWHWPRPTPVLRITSVVNGLCHLEWSPAGSYYLDYDVGVAFSGPVDRVEVTEATTTYEYDCGESPLAGFFRLVAR